MNKNCARCEKTVYPTEELKCLDKVWHKGCFKCQECSMTLNMRTYKGYGKLPYCESHVPKAKHTTMAETPELRRIAENTKIQSNVKYHADFERSKGKFTQVADDPETLRIKANTRIISNVAYHGDLEKKAHMERQRTINENGEIVADGQTDNYHQQIESYVSEMLPAAPAPPPAATVLAPPPHRNHQHHQAPNSSQHANDRAKYADADYNNYTSYQTQNYPPPQQYQTPQYGGGGGGGVYQNQNANAPYQPQPPTDDQYQYTYGQYQQQNYGVGQQQKIGRIQDYDPLNDAPRAPPSGQRATTTLIYNSNSEGRPKGANQPTQHQSRAIGRVTDLDPMVEPEPHHHHHQQPVNQQRVYIAMYDYEANDSDEVSFREGDLISNVTAIDEGWMTGSVLRSGATGMLPANYVELAPQHYRN